VHTTRALRYGILGAALLACEAPYDERVVQEDTRQSPIPVFVVSGPEAPRYIEFFSVNERKVPLWRVNQTGDTLVSLPIRVSYGTPLIGYHEAGPAAPLAPGEYLVQVKFRYRAVVQPFFVGPGAETR
jgi:hypothetical protein